MSIAILSEVQGTGTLRNENTGVTIDGSFEMTYMLGLRCVPTFKFYPHSINPFQLFEFSRQRKEIGPAFTMVQAAAPGGQSIKIESIYNVSSHASTYEREKNFLEFRAQNVLIGEEKAVSEIKFYIPNLEFWATEWSTLPDNTKRVDKSTIQLGNYLIEIKRILNYQDVISELRRTQDEVAITAIITVRSEKFPLDVTSTVELMDVLNELLNLAMGRFVFWPKCEGYQGNKLIWQRLRGQRLHPFGLRLGFVDFESNPRGLGQFLTSSFDNFSEWFSKDRTIARRILHSYLWGFNLPLLETQIYSLSYALEVLVNKFLSHHEKAYSIQNDRKKLFSKFKDFILKEILPKIIDKEKVDELSGDKLNGRIGYFFRRSFKDLITELLKKSQKDHYENDWNKWIKEFVEARNCVVHHSNDKSPEELFRAWCKGLELIELIFLGNNWLSIAHHQSKIIRFRSLP